MQPYPIFLGGQGGLVGPLRIGYGCITAAGSIIRKNELKNDRIILGGGFKDASIPRQVDVYKNVAHIFNNNIYYIAGLISLKFWYKYIRSLFIYDDFSQELIHGMQNNLDHCIAERIKRLKIFSDKLKLSKKILFTKIKDKTSKTILIHEKAIEQFNLVNEIFKTECENDKLNEEGKQFIRVIKKKIKESGKKYINLIQNLTAEEHEKGSKWLFDIEHKIVKKLII